MRRDCALDLARASMDELSILAHYGDTESSSYLWGTLPPLAKKISRLFCAKYSWVNADDLSQAILLSYPKIIRRYNPAKAKFTKYVSISFYRAAQDELRKLDPLGIRIPQKEHYPEFTHLSSLGIALNSHRELHLDGLINEGIARVDRGYHIKR